MEEAPKEVCEAFLREVEAEMERQMRSAYGDLAYALWHERRHEGAMQDPDGYGRAVGPCGDVFEIFLAFGQGRVTAASYRASGCGAGRACCALAVETALGRSPEELGGVTPQALLARLGGLPQEEEHLAGLACRALQRAASHFLEKSRGSTS